MFLFWNHKIRLLRICPSVPTAFVTATSSTCILIFLTNDHVLGFSSSGFVVRGFSIIPILLNFRASCDFKRIFLRFHLNRDAYIAASVPTRFKMTTSNCIHWLNFTIEYVEKYIIRVREQPPKGSVGADARFLMKFRCRNWTFFMKTFIMSFRKSIRLGVAFSFDERSCRTPKKSLPFRLANFEFLSGNLRPRWAEILEFVADCLPVVNEFVLSLSKNVYITLIFLEVACGFGWSSLIFVQRLLP